MTIIIMRVAGARRVFGLLAAVAFGCGLFAALPALADESNGTSAFANEDLFDLSLEELLDVQVFSASKKPQEL